MIFRRAIQFAGQALTGPAGDLAARAVGKENLGDLAADVGEAISKAILGSGKKLKRDNDKVVVGTKAKDRVSGTGKVDSSYLAKYGFKDDAREIAVMRGMVSAFQKELQETAKELSGHEEIKSSGLGSLMENLIRLNEQILDTSQTMTKQEAANFLAQSDRARQLAKEMKKGAVSPELKKAIQDLELKTGKSFGDLVSMADEERRAAMALKTTEEGLRKTFISKIERIATTPAIEELGSSLGMALTGPLWELVKQGIGAQTNLEAFKKIGSFGQKMWAQSFGKFETSLKRMKLATVEGLQNVGGRILGLGKRFKDVIVQSLLKPLVVALFASGRGMGGLIGDALTGVAAALGLRGLPGAAAALGKGALVLTAPLAAGAFVKEYADWAHEGSKREMEWEKQNPGWKETKQKVLGGSSVVPKFEPVPEGEVYKTPMGKPQTIEKPPVETPKMSYESSETVIVDAIEKLKGEISEGKGTDKVVVPAPTQQSAPQSTRGIPVLPDDNNLLIFNMGIQ